MPTCQAHEPSVHDMKSQTVNETPTRKPPLTNKVMRGLLKIACCGALADAAVGKCKRPPHCTLSDKQDAVAAVRWILRTNNWRSAPLQAKVHILDTRSAQFQALCGLVTPYEGKRNWLGSADTATCTKCLRIQAKTIPSQS